MASLIACETLIEQWNFNIGMKSTELLERLKVIDNACADTNNAKRELAAKILAASILKPGVWNNFSGDLVPSFVQQLPTWPKNRVLAFDGLTEVIVEMGKTLLNLKLSDDHYVYLVNNEPIEVPRDGNCFYHALLAAMTPKERAELLGSDDSIKKQPPEDTFTKEINDLRKLCSEWFTENAELFFEFIPYEKICEDWRAALVLEAANNSLGLKEYLEQLTEEEGALATALGQSMGGVLSTPSLTNAAAIAMETIRGFLSPVYVRR